MNTIIDSLKQNGGNQLLIVSLSDLKEFSEYLISNTMKIAKERAEEDARTSTYLTSKEVMNKCGISEATLWRWAKIGYLKPTKLGGSSRRFLLADVENAMKGKDNSAITRNIALLLDKKEHEFSELESCDFVGLMKEIRKSPLTPHVENNKIWITSNIK